MSEKKSIGVWTAPESREYVLSGDVIRTVRQVIRGTIWSRPRVNEVRDQLFGKEGA